ncbi:MAG: hypothetical protein WC312_03665 [Candidatus Omnitrophota bacterium]|jgi:hypothetical protein
MTGNKTYRNYLLIAIIFIIVWQFFCVAVLCVNKTDCFPSLCADGQTRAVLGAKWLHAPFFMNEGYTRNSIWLPLQYWLTGLGLLAWYNLYWIPIIINIICGAALLFVFYNMCRLLFDDPVIGLIELLIAGFVPWFVWLSVSGMSEPLSFLLIVTAFFFYISWIKQIARPGFLWCIGATLTLANMTRNENWAVSVLLAASIIGTYFIHRDILRDRKYRLPFLFVLVAPWVFPLAWTIAQYQTFHDLSIYYYYRHISGRVGGSGIIPPGIFAKRFFIFFQSLAASIPVFVLSFFGAVVIMAKKQKLAVIYLALVLSYSIFLLCVFLGIVVPGLRERVPLIIVLLLSPFAAYAIRKIFSIRLRAYVPEILVKSMVVVSVFIFAGNNISACSNFPAPYKEMASFSSIGRKLGALWDDGILKKGDKVIIIPLEQDAILSYNMIAAYSNHPFDIIVIEEWVGQEKIAVFLNKARIIVLHKDFYDKYQEHIRKASRRIFKIEDYEGFFLTGI